MATWEEFAAARPDMAEAALTTVWKHTMEQRGGMWLPALGGEPPQATRQVWKER